jgi:hypothetical protein
LVPGAGLGRLVFEIVRLGKPCACVLLLWCARLTRTFFRLRLPGQRVFAVHAVCQQFCVKHVGGCALSVFWCDCGPSGGRSVFTQSDWRCRSSKPNEFTIHPWLDNPSNHMRAADMTRGIAIPDVCPSAILGDGEYDFSMCAGDFVEVYGATPGMCPPFRLWTTPALT